MEAETTVPPPMYYSQFGEDRILSEIFCGKTRGVCVEVGANDGVHGSTSLHFERLGWKCVLVEPNPTLCAEIRTVRRATLFECAASNQRGIVTLHVVDGAWRADGMSTVSGRPADHARIAAQGFMSRPVQVPARTLDDILNEACGGEPLDFITIDVEGFEAEVLEGFSLLRWKPTVLILEDNSNGTSTAIARSLARFGYVRFRRTGVNDWYAHRDNRDLVNAANGMRVAAAITVLRVKAALRRVPLLKKVRDVLRRVGQVA